MGRRGIPLALTVVLTGLAAAVGPSSAVAHPNAAVTSDLTIDGTLVYPRLSTTITWRVPLRDAAASLATATLGRRCRESELHPRAPGDARLVRLLLERPDDSRDYACARRKLLAASRLVPAGALALADTRESFATYGFSAQRPTSARMHVLRIRNGVAKLVVSAHGVIVQRARMHLGAWVLEPVADGTRLRVRARAAAVPRDSRRKLVLHVHEMLVASSEPAPQRLDGETMTWLLGPAADAPQDVSVVLQPRAATRAALLLTSGNASAALHRAALLTPLALVLLVALVLLWGAQVKRVAEAAGKKERWTLSARQALLILLGTVVLIGLANAAEGYLPTHRTTLFGDEVKTRLAIIQAPLLLALAAIAFVSATTKRQRRWRGAAMLSLLFAWLVWLIAIPSVGGHHGAVAGIASAAVAAAIIFSATIATAWMALAWTQARSHSSGVAVVIYPAAALLACSATIVWIELLRRLIPRGNAGLWFGSPLPIDDVLWPRLTPSLFAFPAGGLKLLGAFVPVMALAVGAGVLAGHVNRRRPRLLFLGERRSEALVMVGFCAFVVGLGGTIGGWPAPAAFALGLPTLWIALRRKLEHVEQALRGADASAPNGDVLALKQVAIRDAALRPDDPSVTKPSLPDRIEPRSLALALGPEQTWWDNGVRAVRIGALLAIAPVAYFINVGIGNAFGNPYGYVSVLDLVGDVTHEVIFWLVAAFAMGALLPYLPFRNGLLKGAALAGVWGVATLVAALLPHTADALGTGFRLFELTIFLGALGIFLDLRTVRETGWTGLVSLYGSNGSQVALRYVAPVGGVLVTIGFQLLSGDARSAVQEALNHASSFLPTR